MITVQFTAATPAATMPASTRLSQRGRPGSRRTQVTRPPPINGYAAKNIASFHVGKTILPVSAYSAPHDSAAPIEQAIPAPKSHQVRRFSGLLLRTPTTIATIAA